MSSLLLQPEQCCLHIIDPQQSLMAKIHEADRVARVIALMLRSCHTLDVPVVANTQYAKGLGQYVPELQSLVEEYNVPIQDKVEFNAYANEGTDALLKQVAGARLSTVILAGVETHICIYQTAAALLEMGITPWIVADGVSSRSPANHRYGLDRLAALGASVGPAEMIIYELLGRAGSPQFKAILPHIITFDADN